MALASRSNAGFGQANTADPELARQRMIDNAKSRVEPTTSSAFDTAALSAANDKDFSEAANDAKYYVENGWFSGFFMKLGEGDPYYVEPEI